MADKTKASLSTMTGSGVYYTTADGVKYNVRGLKVKWQEEYDHDQLFVNADDKRVKGYGQYFNIMDKEKRDIVFKWFSRLVFNQSTGKAITEEEFGELEYDDLEAILLKIMRMSD